MYFNKDYPIAVLDTNTVIDNPCILDELKNHCNIVIPHTVLDELDSPKLKDKLKKRNIYPRSFLNTLEEMSAASNLQTDGYRFENGCKLYLDRINLRHEKVNLNLNKPDLKFIAEAKNLQEKYNGMEVVLVSKDRNLRIDASIYGVKAKTPEEFYNTLGIPLGIGALIALGITIIVGLIAGIIAIIIGRKENE